MDLRRCAVPQFIALFLAMAPVWAQNATYLGVDVFDKVCAACHAKGADGAPRVGDRSEWQKRAAQGLVPLADHALEGIRNMPPHGGQLSLSRLEIERAIVYMVNQSGGNWVSPSGEQVTSQGRTGAQVVGANCAICHAFGFDGAPRIGVKADWLPRMTLGIDRLVRHANRGYGAMPARAGQPTLTDEDLRSAVLYMVSTARARAAAEQKGNTTVKKNPAERK